MVAVSSSTLANSALVLGLNTTSSPRSISTSTSVNTPKTIADVVSSTLGTSGGSLNTALANNASPATANYVSTNNLSTTATLAALLGSSTSIDGLVEQTNDFAASSVKAATSKPLASINAESLGGDSTTSSFTSAPSSSFNGSTTSSSLFSSTSYTSASSSYDTAASYGSDISNSTNTLYKPI